MVTYTELSLTRGYEPEVAMFMDAFTNIPPRVVANLPGGNRVMQIMVTSPPFAPPDGVAGSDLNAWERAWLRAVYRYMRDNRQKGLSLRVEWGPREAAGRLATLRLVPFRRAPEEEAYCVNPDLQSQYRQGAAGAL